MPRLTQSELLQKYHELYTLVYDDPRIMPKSITKKLGFSGTGKARTTITYHLENMYRKEISLKPQLKILPFSNLKKYAYFCRKIDNKNIFETFLKLHSNKDVSFVQCLSGLDFFITSFRDDIDFRINSLITEKKSVFYRSIYTNPFGWNKDINKCFQSLVNVNYFKGKLERKTYGLLEWSEVDWKTYLFMRKDVRCKFTEAGRYAGVDSKTIKKHFYESILPKCDVAHYFFPEGRDSYREIFLKIETDYEESFVKALQRLPCTSYVYPLDTAIVVVLFQKDEKSTLFILQKLKEIGILNDYLFYTPLVHGSKD